MNFAKIRKPLISTVTGWPALAALALAMAIAGCDGSTGPGNHQQDAIEIFGGLNVSNAVGAPSGEALAAVSPGVAYVSASPKTFEDVVEVTITNLANGASLTVGIVDGGFDPVALEAEPGDELELVLRYGNGSTSTHSTVVPARRRPRVVRTNPPKEATQVVLSTSVVIVFSEPVDEASATTANIQLESGSGAVTGGVELSEDGLAAEFTPAEPLEGGAWYKIVVTTGLRDLDGDPLEEHTEVEFMTDGQAQAHLCAKNWVVKWINNEIHEPWPDTVAGWTGPKVNSTSTRCAGGAYNPQGTFTYNTSGSRLIWEFEGDGFVNWELDPWAWHRYILILIPEGPWPMRDLITLVDGFFGGWPDERGPGTVHLSGSAHLNRDISGGRVWVVSTFWIDVSGLDCCWHDWHNPDRGVPRLTNDMNDDGVGDATLSPIYCVPDCSWRPAEYEKFDFVYDWAFEADKYSLIYFDDTGVETEGGDD